MDDFKWFFAFLFAVALVATVGALFAGQRDAKTERVIAQQCLSSGGQWVTRSVSGDPSNHDCVRRGE